MGPLKSNRFSFWMSLLVLGVGLNSAASPEACIENLNRDTTTQSPKTQFSLGGMITRGILKLRYAIETKGLKDIASRGTESTLFLFNHPAFIDPVIVTSTVNKYMNVRPLMDAGQTKGPIGPIVGGLAKQVRTILLPEAGQGIRSEVNIKKTLDDIVEALINKDNILLYPAGQLARGPIDDLSSKEAASYIIQSYKARTGKDLRVVVGRTTGLWGSTFGRGFDGTNNVLRAVSRGLFWTLANGLFFTPKREVKLEFSEPTDLPRTDRDSLNAYLDSVLNSSEHPNIRVPYHFLQSLYRKLRYGRRDLIVDNPSIIEGSRPAKLNSEIPADLDPKLIGQALNLVSVIGKKYSVDKLEPGMYLNDVGFNSLSKTELVNELAVQFGAEVEDAQLQSVADVVLAAAGLIKAEKKDAKIQASQKWLKQRGAPSEDLPQSNYQTLLARTINQAIRNPFKVIGEDPLLGNKPITNMELLIGAKLFADYLSQFKGERIGIMMPPASGSLIMMLGVQMAGKIPVMVNYTNKSRVNQQILDRSDIEVVLTSGNFADQVRRKGGEFDHIQHKFRFVEDIKEEFGTSDKISAILSWIFGSNKKAIANAQDKAVVLFTSGSEALPKSVPLTNKNIIQNLDDVSESFGLKSDDRIIGFLPLFHSFGNYLGQMSLTQQIPTYFYANALDGKGIAESIHSSKATVLMGTPTFVRNIVLRAKPGQLDSIRYVICGAEKLQKEVRDMIQEAMPNAFIGEGYGTTEASPVVAVNTPEFHREGSVGRILKSIEWEVLDPETKKPVAADANGNRNGLLVIRGPSIMEGYEGVEDADQPFVKVDDGPGYYNTGDLVRIDSEEFLFITGRLKRAIKKGGEMISLEAINSSLQKYFEGLREVDEEGELFAVESASVNDPDVVVFTVKDNIDIDTLHNEQKEAGLPGLANVNRIVKVSKIPRLGTGKTDFKVFKKFLDEEIKTPGLNFEEFLAAYLK